MNYVCFRSGCILRLISKVIGIQKLISNHRLYGLTYRRHLLAIILKYPHSLGMVRRKSLRYYRWIEGMCLDNISLQYDALWGGFSFFSWCISSTGTYVKFHPWLSISKHFPCVYVCTHMCTIHACEGQTCRVGSLLLLCGIQGWTQQVPLLGEPPHQPQKLFQ